MPGGEPISRTAHIEGREAASDLFFIGKVSTWSFQKGFGWIQPSDFYALPKSVQSAVLDHQHENNTTRKQREKSRNYPESAAWSECLYARIVDKAIPGQRFRKGDAVRFKVYLGSNGAGASDIELLEGL